MANWLNPEYLSSIIPPEPMSGLVVLGIISLYALGAWLFAVLFVSFFEADPESEGHKYRHTDNYYRVRSKITKKPYNIWESCDGDGTLYKYPYLRAIIWPLTLACWAFHFLVHDNFVKFCTEYVDKKRKRLEDEQELKRKTQDYLSGKGEL